MNTEFKILIVGEIKFDITKLANGATDKFDKLVVKKVNEISDISDIADVYEKCWDIIICDHHTSASNGFDDFKFIEEKMLGISS